MLPSNFAVFHSLCRCPKILMGCFAIGKQPCPQSCILLTWGHMGSDLRVAAYLFLILYPPLKAETPCQKAPFHVVAVDRQTSGSKMLINLTGSAAVLGALIWNSDWWIGALWGSQGESDSNQFILLDHGSFTPRLISHYHSHTRLHMTFHFLLFVMEGHNWVCFRSWNKLGIQQIRGWTRLQFEGSLYKNTFINARISYTYSSNTYGLTLITQYHL